MYNKLLSGVIFVGAIKLKDLSYSYDGKNKVLSEINFNLRKDKTLSIIGTSNSGKTTLLKILNGELENYIKKEKQQLISYLEDKIKEYKLNLLNLKYNIGTTYEEIGEYKGSLKAYQEALDFVEGGKNENNTI